MLILKVQKKAHMTLSFFAAVQATARVFHTKIGVDFDERNVDVEDVIHVHVSIPLPLGILFRENAGGCSVVRLLEGENASLVQGKERVQVGDQLIAINGKDCLGCTFNDLKKLVSQLPSKRKVKLFLIRYDGPVFPNFGIDFSKSSSDGFEVDFDSNSSLSKGDRFRTYTIRTANTMNEEGRKENAGDNLLPILKNDENPTSTPPSNDSASLYTHFPRRAEIPTEAC
uniref:PDZ domain-containing protein n=1 Tax=Corethron hystrix TaxID=216773 RepID=A0A7S1B9F6_9STRA|mmetsp:Transcript_16990/g.38233  ORF Transcript_16990/g.38233 Transcript_16990/m.38233 type:complete len:227 (+) Transcript_16990:284-964(+)